jgi:hypothetical protein
MKMIRNAAMRARLSGNDAQSVETDSEFLSDGNRAARRPHLNE